MLFMSGGDQKAICTSRVEEGRLMRLAVTSRDFDHSTSFFDPLSDLHLSPLTFALQKKSSPIMGKKGDKEGGGGLFAAYLAAMPEPSTAAGSEGPDSQR